MAKTFTLSNGGSQNSHGFRIDLNGMDLERFRKNPVMLYNHDSERVIGCWHNLRIENGQLVADADIDTDDTLGKEVARKVDKGYLKGCSVGIYIKNMIDTDNGLVATETELLEASIVAIPSDANAVALYDENNKPTNIEQVWLKYNFNKQNNSMEKNMELTAATLSALGIKQEATADAVELAVAAKDARIAALEAQVAAFAKEKVTELINRAISEKKIGADEKDVYIALAEKDYESVSKILTKMQGVAPVSVQLKAQAAAGKYDGKTWDELDRDGLLASLKAEAPEKYAEMYKQKFNL